MKTVSLNLISLPFVTNSLDWSLSTLVIVSLHMTNVYVNMNKKLFDRIY